jgi:hypothetical protein
VLRLAQHQRLAVGEVLEEGSQDRQTLITCPHPIVPLSLKEVQEAANAFTRKV